jgi:hypothetical protein
MGTVGKLLQNLISEICSHLFSVPTIRTMTNLSPPSLPYQVGDHHVVHHQSTTSPILSTIRKNDTSLGSAPSLLLLEELIFPPVINVLPEKKKGRRVITEMVVSDDDPGLATWESDMNALQSSDGDIESRISLTKFEHALSKDMFATNLEFIGQVSD